MQALNGFLTCEYFASIKDYERELERGKNDFSLFQAWSLASIVPHTLSNLDAQQSELKIFKVLKKVTDFLGYTGFFANLGKLGLSQVAQRLSASYVSQYCSAKVINLSKAIKEPAHKFVVFCENNLSTIIEVAQVTSVIALVCFGHYAFGIGYAVSYTYRVLDRNALIPQKISNVLSNVFHTIAIYHNFYFHPGFFSAINVVLITASLLPKIPVSQKVADFVQKAPIFVINKIIDKVSQYFPRYSIKKYLCTYEDVERPITLKKHMSFQEIRSILLEKNPEKFDLCLEALSKKALRVDELDQNEDLDKMKALFDSIDWSKKRDLIVAKLKIDERFIGILESSGFTRQKIEENLDQTVSDYFIKNKKTPEEYFAENFDHFLGVCAGKLGYESFGTQNTLFDVKKKAHIINSYLIKLGEEKRTIELEDLLLKIGVEAGKYCNLGLKRAIDEIIEQIMDEKVEGSEVLETKIYGHLENCRKALADRALLEGLQDIKSDHLYSDVHINDLIKYQSFYGFIPLNRELNYEEFLFAHSKAHGLKILLLRTYHEKLHDYLNEMGCTQKMNQYILQLIGDNQTLSEIERQTLLELIVDHDQIPIRTMQIRLNHLLLCMLGIIKKIA